MISEGSTKRHSGSNSPTNLGIVTAQRLTVRGRKRERWPVADIIYPRSPRETMCGWMHLPRFVDKVRLNLAGRLHTDYQTNFGKGFDAMWLEAAGVKFDEFVKVVKDSITDGEVADWVLHNVKKTEAEKRAHAERMLNSPAAEDVAAQARLRLRKEQAGIAPRDDVQTFIDVIDADEDRI